MKKMLLLLIGFVIVSQLVALTNPRINKRQSNLNSNRFKEMSGFAYQQTYKRIMKEKLPVALHAALTVCNENGTVKIIGWEHDYMLVETKTVSFRDKNDLNQAELTIRENGSYYIETQVKERIPVQIHLKIFVPKNMLIDKIETANGTVRMINVEKNNVLDTNIATR
jgi:hypothetical protein